MIFVCAQILLSLGASASYFYRGDHWRGVYWLGGAVLTFCVTRMK